MELIVQFIDSHDLKTYQCLKAYLYLTAVLEDVFNCMMSLKNIKG